MITRHKDRAVLQLAGAAITIIVGSTLAGFLGRERMEDMLVVILFAYVGAVVLLMMGSFSLARAKGYETDMMGCILVFLYFAGFLFPLAPLLLPGIVIFGLKDKTKTSYRTGKRRARVGRED